ncbi:SGNH/GDSL hydrolase family protein [Leuconostoc rapi]|uniref:SGNH/GDSL hydrolase family protein n=1 Tax=Leuconostoc rapi TaxID=1406906 RepID=UPI00195A691D|nr:SGNH/GDSL hydrolase family protein [Leuconostoc rapi]MBM7435661.1 hypothetical protein [Leuconostoc rapi]
MLDFRLITKKILKQIVLRLKILKLKNYTKSYNRPIVVDHHLKRYFKHAKLKRIGIIGDSVSFGLKSTINYGHYIQKVTGANVQNLAISGAHLTDNGVKSIFQQATRLNKCDLYIFQSTDDDWLANITIGNKHDTAKQSYLGAFYQTVLQLRRLNSQAKIIVLTTTYQTPVWGSVVRRTDLTHNKLGYNLHDYMAAVKKACVDLNIPCVDLMRSSLFTPSNSVFRAKYMPDGLHPNEEGHHIIALEIGKIYKKLI